MKGKLSRTETLPLPFAIKTAAHISKNRISATGNGLMGNRFDFGAVREKERQDAREAAAAGATLQFVPYSFQPF